MPYDRTRLGKLSGGSFDEAHQDLRSANRTGIMPQLVTVRSAMPQLAFFAGAWLARLAMLASIPPTTKLTTVRL